MDILCSSIAWKRDSAEDVARLLVECGVSGIEASPGIFDRPLAELKSAHVQKVRRFWEDHGLSIRAMQALLFGQPHLKLFGSETERKVFTAYLQIVFRVAGQLGCGPLVFGSPRNRKRGELTEEAAFAMAVDFFGSVAPLAHAEGCTLCIEANATGYGCDFITSHADALRLVAAVGTQGFGMQIDTGVMQMNKETARDVLDTLRREKMLPVHVHVSEPFLAPVTQCGPLHRELCIGLAGMLYAGAVSIEMKEPEFLEIAVPKALRAAIFVYGG